MTKNKILYLETMPSPIGELYVVWGEDGLYAIEFGDDFPRLEKYLARHKLVVSARPKDTSNPFREKLDKYFAGDMDALENLPVVSLGSDFIKKVWAELRNIPPGTTRSYGQVAHAIGRPSASRAVGAANGRNPISIVVPCHRVIGQDGTLTGYAGGLKRKQWLLQHEGAL